MTMIVEISDGMRLDRGSIPLISICLKKARVIDTRVFFVFWNKITNAINRKGIKSIIKRVEAIVLTVNTLFSAGGQL